MFLFKDKDIVEIPVKCKYCMEEIIFTVTDEEYKQINKFPIKKESIHGEPPHELIVFINQNLEVDNFEIKEIEELDDDLTVSEKLSKQVLSDINLSDEEIEIYFRVSGREAVTLGEISILMDKPKEEVKKIAEKFVEKGLFKEIVGAIPHYAALPPYAALVAQLRSFSSYISDIKSKIPIQLDKSFIQLESEAKGMENLKESSEVMQDLKEKMLSQIHTQKKEFDETITAIDQIRNITDDISQLEDLTKNISEDQISTLTKQFENLNLKTSRVIKNQIDGLRAQFGDIKKIIADNLQKLRLGVIQQAVGDVIDKVVENRLKDITDNLKVQLSVSQTVFADELKKTTQGIDSGFVENLKKSIQNAVKNIEGLSVKSGDEKEKEIATLISNFDEAVKMAEQKIDGISGGIFKSFGNIKEIFSKGIVDSLDHTLEDILKRLELTERTTQEFWEQSKKARGSITMKDIWFIRSLESAKAHINDEISKAKMRVLIVAPTLSDIDISMIKARPSRINFRISTHIDPSLPKHEVIMNELDTMDNVDYRNRTLQNLWGINRDYEEVILCVLSKTEFRGETITEIAGIGSIIEEHIKIFVPILEDAWVGARKHPLRSIKTSFTKESEDKPTFQKVDEGLGKEPTKFPFQRVEEPKVKEPSKIETESKPQGIEPNLTEPPRASFLSNFLDEIMNTLDGKTGPHIAAELERFQGEFVKREGYNSVLKDIHNTASEIKNHTEELHRPEIENLKLSMKVWKQRLNL
ncbi:hypothetical protein LCGC14_1345030 [marine sediment metagenome]|uniref:Transcription regulator TrmB N-terminal domain-containing protein n=1 Tax=marine sediment metagenome TaxID=412755 RepID=A0A0F9MTG0_9ZZZZ